MLTVIMKVEDLYLEIMYEFYGELLHRAVKKLNECSKQLDAEGMKYYTEVCRGLVMRREKAFKKRLWIRGY